MAGFAGFARAVTTAPAADTRAACCSQRRLRRRFPTLLGSLSQLTPYATPPVNGDVALLFVAVVLLRMLPQGITGRFFRRSL